MREPASKAAADDPAANLQRALALHRDGQSAAAKTAFERILAREPRSFEALNHLGIIAGEQQDFRRAADLFGRALAVHPGSAEVHCNRGFVLHALGEWTAALGCYDRAVALKPDFAGAHFKRGDTLQSLERWEAALASYERALVYRPDSADACLRRAYCLYRLDRCDEALASCERAVALKPDSFVAHADRGNILRKLNRFAEALASHERALALCPDYAEGHYNRGNVLADLGDLAAAIASFERAIELRPQLAEPRYARALALLTLGDFAAGWADYEWRWQLKDAATMIAEPRPFAQPRWRGEQPLAGRRVLLHAEQGLGDTLQFCRYAKLLADRGAHVILQVQGPLVGVMRTLRGVSRVLALGEPTPEFDFHCPLMSLPLACNTRLDAIPCEIGYLAAGPQRREHWRTRLGVRTKPRIGLAWTGNPRNANDRNRSMPLATLLAGLSGDFEYVSLHRELEPANRHLLARGSPVRHFGDEQTDFEDAAALCACMDAIVSVDTSLAHLGAALGKPTKILLAANADWRWLRERSDSPWYPTVKLYRQRTLGEWSSVLAAVMSDLRVA